MDIKEKVFELLNKHQNDTNYLKGFYDCLELILSNAENKTNNEMVGDIIQNKLSNLKVLRVENGI